MIFSRGKKLSLFYRSNITFEACASASVLRLESDLGRG
jgi:hypothetical protein